MAGITVAIVAFSVLSSALPERGSDNPAPIGGVIKIILGGLLLFLALKQWRGRPRDGEPATLPKWMAAVDHNAAIMAVLLLVLGVSVLGKGISSF